jgi:hypothetical protein
MPHIDWGARAAAVIISRCPPSGQSHVRLGPRRRAAWLTAGVCSKFPKSAGGSSIFNLFRIQICFGYISDFFSPVFKEFWNFQGGRNVPSVGPRPAGTDFGRARGCHPVQAKHHQQHTKTPPGWRHSACETGPASQWHPRGQLEVGRDWRLFHLHRICVGHWSCKNW